MKFITILLLCLSSQIIYAQEDSEDSEIILEAPIEAPIEAPANQRQHQRHHPDHRHRKLLQTIQIDCNTINTLIIKPLNPKNMNMCVKLD